MIIFLAILLLAIPAMVFLANAVLNGFTRIDPHRTPFLGGYGVTALALVAYLSAKLFFCGSLQPSALVGATYILIYSGCVTFLNWFLFTITDVSMHVRIAYLLHRHEGISPQEIQELYNKQVIVGNRTARLVELGQLKLVDGRYVLGGKEVLFGAAVCRLLRRLLGIPVSPELQDHFKT